MSREKILATPVKAEDLEGINAGDIIYLNGHIVTCRDVAHRRLIEEKRPLPVDIREGAIYHAGPIIRPLGNDKFEMVSIGATTSMRMEKSEYEFVKQTGVRIIVGKGGMGEGTRRACMEFKALHVVYPAGCAVCAAVQVEEIEQAEWRDLGMPETLWVCRIREFGPLVVSIDTYGNNLFEQNKVVFNQRKEEVYGEIAQQVSFIK
jgi:L(+)-tartrate dehydratase beta subunit